MPSDARYFKIKSAPSQRDYIVIRKIFSSRSWIRHDDDSIFPRRVLLYYHSMDAFLSHKHFSKHTEYTLEELWLVQ